eukprot:TRINITY_DN20766_c0_g1_i1.p1 TRINITY_DN20766_c0_g1~~TRINITY_DN20766_c0_g1_i1.p1  ORF type:complete len:929 (+),score=414.41 TRINITY_DN20766_c0_g1_i1:108-2894(+)
MITLQNFEIPNHNTSGLETTDGRWPYNLEKEARIRDLVEGGVMKLPETYWRNTTKEEMCLEFVDNFKNQYTQLYPNRAALLLSPRNESGMRKFVCTFVRPTELPYEELYDWESPGNPGKGCAAYIANYIRYEELPRPTELPPVVVSPATTLKWQIGDCFDMSILLASLLLGTGYDAYVIIGYATQDVCQNNQDRKTWVNDMEPVVSEEAAKTKSTAKGASKYFSKLKQRPNLESVFDKEQAKKKNAKKAEDVKEVDDDKEAEEDPLQGKRVHAWVMLVGSSSKRKDESITEGDCFFVEPSTGQRVEITDPNYLGVESMFNNHNYWVSMQENKTGNEHRSKDFFNLGDLMRWEPVFVIEDEDDEEDPNDATVGVGGGGERERRTAVNEDQDLVPPSWVQRLTLSRRQYENRYPSHHKLVTYKNAKIDLHAEYSEEDLKVRVVSLKDEFGGTTFGETHTFFRFRKDKLMRRAVYPARNADGAQTMKTVQHEWFDEGRWQPLPGEQPPPGASQEALAQHIFEEGVKRTMIFYGKARLDGLTKRVEVFFPQTKGNEGLTRGDDPPAVKKIMEYYKARDDRLIYRSATFHEPSAANHHESRAQRANLYAGAGSPTDARTAPPLKKMAEKFERNPDVPADQDCAKRTFYITLNEIKVEYHYGEGRITRSNRHYSKDQKSAKDRDGEGIAVTIPLLQPHQKKPGQAVLAEELRMLGTKEKKCLDEIRSKQAFAEEILKNREEEEGRTQAGGGPRKCQAEITVYDTLRNETKEAKVDIEQRKADERRRAEQRKDYLAPYLAQYAKGGDTKNIRLTGKDAIDVKNQVLKDLKERLIQRAHIMQNRLDREKEELARHQTNFHKAQEQMTETKEHDHFIQIVENAIWRIGILETRLERHQQEALQKYANLDMKLREDERLNDGGGAAPGGRHHPTGGGF